MRHVVGVLRGGPSSEYDLSLLSGAALHAALAGDEYDLRDVFVDKRGMWHLRGRPLDPARALSQVDVAVNLLHGGPGEDGTVQRMLDRLSVPYVGSRALPAGLSLNKARAKDAFRSAGVRVPQGVAFSVDDGADTHEMAQVVFSRFGPPYVVKPVLEGSSHGIRIAPHVVALPDVLGDVLDEHGGALVEEYVVGPEVTVGVVENYRGEELYALPPAEVQRPPEADRIERAMLTDGSLSHTCPSSISHDLKREVEDMAKRAHAGLGLSHYSQADIILSCSGPVLLEVDSIPTFHEKAAFPRMLEAVGSSVRDLFAHLINLARGRR